MDFVYVCVYVCVFVHVCLQMRMYWLRFTLTKNMPEESVGPSQALCPSALWEQDSIMLPHDA